MIDVIPGDTDLRASASKGRWRRTIVLAVTAGAALVLAAELTSRVEDFVLSDTPLWTTPDRARDLVIRDQLGVRGRPNGHYKQWHLNAYGFRSGPMSRLPKPGVVRVMVLGASETFGLYERDGREYPARLGARLSAAGRSYEVVNAAVAGLTLPGISELWENWAVRFNPAIVVIYPTVAFYLGDGPPRRPRPRTTPDTWSIPKPRLLDALTERFDVPDFIQKRRVAGWLAAAEANRPPDWQFRTVPGDRLAQFGDDLASLVDAVRAAGAEPIVMTHAVGFHNPPRADEADVLDAWRAMVPRAAGDVLLAFEEQTSRVSRQIADEHGARLVDLHDRMAGRREWFAEDYVHFSEEGADRVASLIADVVLGGPGSGRF